jgi:hypothetical protein
VVSPCSLRAGSLADRGPLDVEPETRGGPSAQVGTHSAHVVGLARNTPGWVGSCENQYSKQRPSSHRLPQEGCQGKNARVFTIERCGRKSLSPAGLLSRLVPAPALDLVGLLKSSHRRQNGTQRETPAQAGRATARPGDRLAEAHTVLVWRNHSREGDRQRHRSVVSLSNTSGCHSLGPHSRSAALSRSAGRSVPDRRVVGPALDGGRPLSRADLRQHLWPSTCFSGSSSDGDTVHLPRTLFDRLVETLACAA